MKVVGFFKAGTARRCFFWLAYIGWIHQGQLMLSTYEG